MRTSGVGVECVGSLRIGLNYERHSQSTTSGELVQRLCFALCNSIHPHSPFTGARGDTTRRFCM